MTEKCLCLTCSCGFVETTPRADKTKPYSVVLTVWIDVEATNTDAARRIALDVLDKAGCGDAVVGTVSEI